MSLNEKFAANGCRDRIIPTNIPTSELSGHSGASQSLRCQMTALEAHITEASINPLITTLYLSEKIINA